MEHIPNFLSYCAFWNGWKLNNRNNGNDWICNAEKKKEGEEVREKQRERGGKYTQWKEKEKRGREREREKERKREPQWNQQRWKT